MVSVHKITGIWIEDIEKIEVTEPERPGELAYTSANHHLDNQR